MFPFLSFPFLLLKCFPFFVHSILNFPWLLIFFSISPYYITNIPSPILPLIVPSPRTLTLTFCILITTLLCARLWICPALSFPHGPALAHASNHPALC